MKRIIYILLAAAALSALSCGRRDAAERGERMRGEWKETLTDSISSMERQVKLTQDSITMLYKEISDLLQGFTYIDNPRYVEGYTIRNGWQNRYPLTSTGMLARMTKSEGFELIAALSPGTFTYITATRGARSASTKEVGPDQGLNYRSGSLTTVAFTDGDGDDVGRLIAKGTGPVTVTFHSGSKSSTVTLRADAADMIAQTWRLVENHRNVKRMERALPLYARKIDACRRAIMKLDGSGNSNNPDSIK